MMCVAECDWNVVGGVTSVWTIWPGILDSAETFGNLIISNWKLHFVSSVNDNTKLR